MYDLVLFDFDGTVFDTVEGITKSVQYSLKKFGIHAELDQLVKFAGPPLVDIFMETYGFTSEQAYQAVTYFRERYRPIGLYESKPFDGIEKLLQDLRLAGKKTGITTIKVQSMAEELLERAGITGCFDVVCGSPLDQSLTKKGLVEKAMSLLGAEKEKTVLVGDTKYDFYGAEEAGVAFIGAGYGYAPKDLEAAGAKNIVYSVAELGKLLLG